MWQESSGTMFNSDSINESNENLNVSNTKMQNCSQNKSDLKYGDSAVCSKRRKLWSIVETNQALELNDDYEEFCKYLEENPSNSSMLLPQAVGAPDVNEVLNADSDFKGGLLLNSNDNNQSPEKALNETNNAKCNDISNDVNVVINSAKTITKKPSLTSKGYENTFKLLENQVEENEKVTRLILDKISPSSSAHNSLSDTLPDTAEISDEIVQNDPLDLQLAAMERLYSITANNSVERCDSPKFTKFLYDYTSTSASGYSLSENEDECSGSESKEIMYHAAIDANGKKHLRTIRPLKGNRVLCGNRVSQMTRAYDDIEAVTRLLEEKEKDLELTVQIGKELLTQNNTLENRIKDLEADLKASNDDRAQLLHELHQKNELISVLTNDGDDLSEADTPNLSKSITLDLLQKKIATLQDENKSLRIEATQLASQTDSIEEHERQLMEDISAQLKDAHGQYDGISLELERQREENHMQHEQIVSLTARLAETEMRLHQLTQDNDEHITLLNITKENQNSLAMELVEFKQRYQEVLALLHDTQEQLSKHRKKSMPQARPTFMSSIGMLQPESLHSELMESSMYSENSLDSGIAGDNHRVHDRISRMMSSQMSSNGYGSLAASSMGASSLLGVAGGPNGSMPPYKRVFETVRCASKNGNYADSGNASMSQLGAMSMSSVSGPRMSTTTLNANPAGSFYRNSCYDGPSLGLRTFSTESLASQSDDSYPSQAAGVPGAPGAKDLEAALKRLTPAEVLARRAMLSHAPVGTYTYDENPHAPLPLGMRTPDSIMSTGSSRLSSSSASQWRLPEKLQIVKPIEGSQTLHHWSRLATPTLSGLLEERPGVTIRGGRGLEDLGMQVYTLSDVEEDITEELPGKQFDASGYTYTYTTSVVMHPDDGIVDLSFLSQSQMSSRMASTSTSRQPSCPPTPRAGLSRKNSCSTFSVNLGLASMLNERGIKAITPSALNTPAGPNFTPTVTPCNSPEGSPPRAASPEPLFGILASGADMIRRKLVGGDIERHARHQQQKQQQVMLSRLERRALRSLRLLEKVESIGLENIIATQPCNSGIASRSCSPASSLKHLHTSSNNIVDDIHFDRNQIKGVLHRGLKSPASSISSSYRNDSGGESDSDSGGGIMIKDIKKKTNASSTPLHSSSSSSSSIITAGTSIAKQPPSSSTSATVAQNITGTTTAALTSADVRIQQMQRQKSRRNLKNGIAPAQRPDLGTIGNGRIRPDLGKVTTPLTQQQQEQNASSTDGDNRSTTQSLKQSLVGTVSSLIFGRKGGWL